MNFKRLECRIRRKHYHKKVDLINCYDLPVVGYVCVRCGHFKVEGCPPPYTANCRCALIQIADTVTNVLKSVKTGYSGTEWDRDVKRKGIS